LMAAAGLGSRRKCEELITAGRVQVNGKTVEELGAKADPQRDRVLVDGQPLRISAQHHYYKVHKPRGVLGDLGGAASERKTVADLLPPEAGRVFPVGRLDLHSEGLLLLTDDGELAHRLTHPRYEHPKTYYVLVESVPTMDALLTLRSGVELPDGRTSPAEVEVVEALPEALRLSRGPNQGVWLRIVLREGKKRQIRHMTAAVGFPTLRLVRWAIGPLTLGRLKLGEWAALTAAEVGALRQAAGLDTAPAQKKQGRSKRPVSRAGARAGSPSRSRRTPSRTSAPRRPRRSPR
ncbi:MAG: rRNA pseudouridine synthase, partial [Caldilineaceae bacterium]|nr:rRNA pseudouridine synthase [Caldilineaceae bacterium]